MEFYDDDSNSNDEGFFLFFEWDEEKMRTDWEDEKTG